MVFLFVFWGVTLYSNVPYKQREKYDKTKKIKKIQLQNEKNNIFQYLFFRGLTKGERTVYRSPRVGALGNRRPGSDDRTGIKEEKEELTRGGEIHVGFDLRLGVK